MDNIADEDISVLLKEPLPAGGTPAEFDPPSEYYLEYEWGLAQYMGYGVAPCYRGPRLYDSIPTMQLVQKWVGFFKKYRDILISDIVHTVYVLMGDAVIQLYNAK